MNQLRQLMLEELQRRNFAATASPLDALTFSSQGGDKHNR